MDYKMEGTLKKYVEKVKLFQMTLYPKRYFIIDFTSANIYIKHDELTKINQKEQNAKRVKVIPFRSIQDSYMPGNEVPQSSLPKGWKFIFYVQTIDRVYCLCA